MIIRGILDRSLSNQICVRGFARIKELARVSKADPEYQRELIDKQKKVISNFLTDETYLFFPEVILSLKLRYDLTQPKAIKENTPIQRIESNKSFISNVNSLKISPSKRNHKTFDVNENDSVIIVDIEIDDAELNELIAQNKHPFHRIDGNHRLSAAEQIESDRVGTMNVPFCIVLFEELTNEVFDPESGNMIKKADKKYEKFERVVFYNINSKTLPLTLEQNLKGILGQEKHFSDDEIEKIFGASGVLARKLGLRVNAQDFEHLNPLLKNQKWSLCLQLLQLVETRKPKNKPKTDDNLINKLFASLQAINTLYGEHSGISQNKSADKLISFVYAKAFMTANTFDFFKSWIVNHHFFKAKEITYETILTVFKQINDKRHIKVFVAMPYWTDALVTDYNKLFKEALAEVQAKAKSQLDLELIPIMRFKGETERIDKRLLEKIRECDVFIAELTDCNQNVCFEIAFAEGCQKPIIMVKAKDDDSTPPFDMDKLQYIPYGRDTYYNSIKGIIRNNLPEILKKQGVQF